MYAFQCHGDPIERQNIFTCRSSFTPFVAPVEQISLQDHVPESVKQEKKKSGGIEYLPGERLLIKLAKQRKKEKIDIDRVTQSMSRVLATFKP
jgi:hypothetical protein